MIEKTYHIITFGCQMNVHDSHWLGRALGARGFFEAPLEDAQVVVVNTCSVREKPEQKVMSTLGRIRQVSGGNPAVLVCVAGCVAQQLGESIFEKESQVRLVAGSDGIGNAPQAIERLLETPAQRLSLLDFTSQYVEREGTTEPGVVSGSVAYANIMQGCDNFCAYCIVPFTRGRQKSRSSTAILDECKALIDNGAREITLLGQNVNAFGQDKSGDGTSFAALLRKVAALPGLERLRYVTPHPKDMGPEDIAAFAELPQLCPRLHLPMPILLILPHDSEVEQLRTLGCGASALISRPYSFSQLKAHLDFLANSRSSLDDLEKAAHLADTRAFDEAVATYGILLKPIRQPEDYFRVGMPVCESWAMKMGRPTA